MRNRCRNRAILTLRPFLFLFLLLFASSDGRKNHPNFKRKPNPTEDEQIAFSPFNQHLPDCKKTQEIEYLEKRTSAKAMACPMFRDEEGFLSEWLAYYKLMGFDHIMMFDDGSVDKGLVELEPWINSGFVTVHQNWSIDDMNIRGAFLKNDFKKAMAIKAILESECKLKAIEWGYDYYLSADLDEYVVPATPGETFIDEVERWTNTTGRQVYCIGKYNFQSGPHLLEPVHLLTIEAYQSRMKHSAKMNYYTSVAPKCLYRFHGPESTNNSARFIAECCHFHGCQGHDFRTVSDFCHTEYKNEAWRVNGKGKKWLQDVVYIYHYSRSLEKFTLKQKTWRTSSGEIKEGQTSEQAARNYDVSGFFQRSLGWTHDSTALRYTCQTREILKNITGETFFLRHGDFWYRNPEFGREVSDPDKRGRYGRQNKEGFKYNEFNPYHYHGDGHIGVHEKFGSNSGDRGSTSVSDVSSRRNLRDHHPR